jgi:arsenate reductase
MAKVKVLFICGHNSGRSQMAEAFLNDLAGDKIYAESAGLEPQPVNPLVVAVMAEMGYDLSRVKSDSVFDFFKQGRLYNYAITMCDETAGRQCPVFPGITQRLHWPFEDPGQLLGTYDEKLAALRRIRDQIRDKITAWIKTIS